MPMASLRADVGLGGRGLPLRRFERGAVRVDQAVLDRVPCRVALGPLPRQECAQRVHFRGRGLGGSRVHLGGVVALELGLTGLEEGRAEEGVRGLPADLLQTGVRGRDEEEGLEGEEAGNPSAGLNEACKKTSDPSFCTLLLQPSAAQFTTNDPKQMGFAAVSATLDKVKGVRTFMMGKAAKGAMNKELRGAINDCIDQIGRGERALRTAVGGPSASEAPSANAPRKLGAKAVPIHELGTATKELTTCRDALRKNVDPEAPADDENANIGNEAVRATGESVLACDIAKSLFMP
ncbi:hypothetical protein SASPL_147786 [Salvia splendens]|uniref:Pectinesterase inhibitor domain-containing protein n=1 Tax=Salvia splendens TaxID=180675 RepID=A0A8X8WFV6_SALSN|nr:hypothetical protein SASPL_147786 [Salvia splendens]